MEFKIYFFVSLFIFVNGYGLPNKQHNNGRHRRRPQIDQTAYYDQSAHATSGLWPDNRNLITSASHTQVYQLDEGDVAHSNFVMTVTPTKKIQRQTNDINFGDGLDSAKTAEEYVTKAVKLHNQYEGGRKRIPTSSFTKYNYIEHPTPIEKEPTMEQHHQATRHTNYNSEPEKFTQEETSYYPPKTTPQPQQPHYHQDHQTINHYNPHVKSSPEPQNSQNNIFHPSVPVKHHIIKIIEDIPQPQPTQSTGVAGMNKAELMSHIEQSVMKMFHEMERQKKQQEEKAYHKTFHHATTPRPQPPSTTEPSPQVHQQIHHNVQHHTIKVAAKQPVVNQAAQYSADIIVREHRGRPTTNPSNTYNYNSNNKHNGNFDHNGILKTAQGFDTENIMHSRPVNKLHFNQQTYHDINALPYIAEKDVHGLSNGYYKKGYSYDGHGNQETVGTATSVGATISFGAPNIHNNNNLHQKQHEPGDDQGYTTTGPIHVINGIPVANSYKMDLNAIRYMLDGLSQAQVYDSDPKHHQSTNDNEDDYHGSPSSKYQQQQQPDSYSPKYNNNPKGVGYQDESPRTPRKQKHGSHEYHKNDGSTFRHQPAAGQQQQHWNNQQHDYDENDEGWHGSSGTHQTTGDQYGSSTKTFQNHQSTSSGKAKATSKFSKNSSNLKSNHVSSHNNSNSSSSSSNSSNNSSRNINSSHNSKNSNYRNGNNGRDVDVEMRPPPKYIKF